MTGRVHLVGAGPGDPGLLTARALELIARADVVLYDRLIPKAALERARADAELLFVGKQGGGESAPQEQTEQLMIDRAQAGRMVVRLKGGDPFVFGRGGEEALRLREAGIPYEVVPGITAGVAAAAYAGIPVTYRGLASAVALVTGHEDPDKDETALDWQALGEFPGTLVFYMGVRRLADIASSLIAAGRSPEEPVAIVERGTLPDQRTVTGILATIADVASAEEVRAPSIAIVGAVASLAGKLAWLEPSHCSQLPDSSSPRSAFQPSPAPPSSRSVSAARSAIPSVHSPAPTSPFTSLPLAGLTVAVTRARASASGLAQQLHELGALVLRAPVIRTVALPGEAPDMASYDLVCLTSPVGVEELFKRLSAGGEDARALAGTRVAAIGPGTAAALAARGIDADIVPERSVAEGLVEALAGVNPPVQRALIARAREGRDVLADALRASGAEVDVLALYETVAEPLSRRTLEKTSEADYITFTSASTVRYFMQSAGDAAGDGIGSDSGISESGVSDSGVSESGISESGISDGGVWLSPKTRIVSIGPITSEALREHGLHPHVEAEDHDVSGLVRALVADASRCAP